MPYVASPDSGYVLAGAGFTASEMDLMRQSTTVVETSWDHGHGVPIKKAPLLTTRYYGTQPKSIHTRADER